MTAGKADQLRASALAAEQSGDLLHAMQLIGQAVTVAPSRADLYTTAGNIALRAGRVDDAVAAFAKAHLLAPAEIDFALNYAIALGRAARPSEAVRVLAGYERDGRQSARFCSARAALERERGALGEAQVWYDACLAADPRHARGLHGRARIALERGDPRATALFDQALHVSPGDLHLLHGRAQTLEIAGDRTGARALGAAILQRAPGWLEALRMMAQLRLGDGEEDFTVDYREAARLLPNEPAILADWAATLSGLGYEAEAAEVARQGHALFGDGPGFALLEAIYAGASGDHERAEALFRSTPTQGPARDLHEARHRIRRGELAAAENLLGSVLAALPDNVTAWALLDVVWRLTGDERHRWLHGQAALVNFLPLEMPDEGREAATTMLDDLHDSSTIPLGQSVRGGSQTRGGLFHRLEPILADLKQAIERTLGTYRSQLPPQDADHPLLRHRDAPWQIAGSWSVRLDAGNGLHVSHIHPNGIVSSALYLRVPSEAADEHAQSGWLEVGRPAADLQTALGPVHLLQPKAGYLALFPSTLYHGPTPCGQGRRMTVAFDVSTVKR